MTRDSTDLAPDASVMASIAHVHEIVRTPKGAEDGMTYPHTLISDGNGHLPSEESHKQSSTKEKIRALKSKTKAKTKTLLHRDHEDPLTIEGDHKIGGALSNIETDLAFHPTGVIEEANQQPDSPSGAVDKTVAALKNARHMVAHPRSAPKSKAERSTAATLSTVLRPQLDQSADRELLQAHDDLSHVQSAKSGAHGLYSGNDNDAEYLEVKIKELEEHRESARIAWITKHIDRVRVVPRQLMKMPEREFFIDRDAKGTVMRYKWELWLGYFLIYHTQNFTAQYIDDLDELPFDIDKLRDHVERIVLASAPWQKWAMDVRHIYRWDNPARTIKWLLVYVLCWYYQFMVGFVYSYILYLVISNHYYPSHVKSAQESVDRSAETDGTAYQFSELIEKYGRENWLQPVLEQLGPYIQLQLGDIANLLEVLANFYTWRSPRKTIYSLCVFAACLLICLCTDMIFCIKMVWFFVGGVFFLFWPISSQYPKYRMLVSPLKWAFWAIPTDAEYSFSHLRSAAQRSRELLITRAVTAQHLAETTSPPHPLYDGHISLSRYAGPSPSSSTESFHSVRSIKPLLAATDLLAFRATHAKHPGRLIIHPSGLRFVLTHTSTPMWNIPFTTLAEMRKIDGTQAKLAKVSGLLPKHVKHSSENLELKLICTRDASGRDGGRDGHDGRHGSNNPNGQNGGIGRDGEVGAGDAGRQIGRGGRQDGEVLLLEGVVGRDDAFNAVVGFSGLQWQNLQTGPGRSGNGSGSGRGEVGGAWEALGSLGTMGKG